MEESVTTASGTEAARMPRLSLALSKAIKIQNPQDFPNIPQIQGTKSVVPADGDIQFLANDLFPALERPVEFSFIAASLKDTFCPFKLTGNDPPDWLSFRVGADGTFCTTQILTGPSPVAAASGSAGLDTYKGTYPYATELFGTYQPLLGWRRQYSDAPTIGRRPPAGALARLPSATGNEGPLAYLSPVGLMDLFREYFFELDSFLGPPAGHIWLSPGGTVEMVEVSTRKLLQEQTIVESQTSITKTEEDLTQQDNLADAVKEDNENDSKLGISATEGASFAGILHASATESYGENNAVHKAQEESHKHSRTQSEKVSSEIRRNFKTSFRTVSETTDTTSRRYVLQNATDRLVNYELRRKMCRIAVQLQHIGTRLCWQVYLDNPGRPLGLGEMVQVVEASPTTSTLAPPDPPPALLDKQTALTVTLPFQPSLTDSDTAPRTDDYFIDGGPDATGMHNHDSDAHIDGRYEFDAPAPDAGYTLGSVTLLAARHTNGDTVIGTSLQVVSGPAHFYVQFQFVNFGDQPSIVYDLSLNWHPPVTNPAQQSYEEALQRYKDKLLASERADYANAIRARLKLISRLKARPSTDLREEERHIIYGSLIERLTYTLSKGIGQEIVAELVGEIFDVDDMLYFVAPDYWKPRAVDEPPPPVKCSILPSVPDDGSPQSLYGATVQGWYGLQDTNNNVDSNGQQIVETRDNYLITEETTPAPMGSSLGWLIQIDGDERRNEFLNSAWVKAVFPVRPGHELDALDFLRAANVEGEGNLDAPYYPQPGDPADYAGKKIGEVLQILASNLQKANTDFKNNLATEKVYEDGFDPLEGGFRVAAPFKLFDQWIEAMPTDQVVAVEYSPGPPGVTGRP